MAGKKKVLISFEGQQHPVDEDIANDDNELRKLLTTYYPDCANADIIRKPGELDSVTMKQMIKAIELAIAQGTDDVKAVERTKERLFNSRSVTGAVSMGF